MSGVGTGDIEPRRGKPSEEIRADRAREQRQEKNDHELEMARLKSGLVKFNVVAGVVGLVLVMGAMVGISYFLAGTTTILGVTINVVVTLTLALTAALALTGAGWRHARKGQKTAEERNRELSDENEALRDEIQAIKRENEELRNDQPRLDVGDEEEGK